jgi:aryl-alcohol dehydrogenase-like predicted oxidoreductase
MGGTMLQAPGSLGEVRSLGHNGTWVSVVSQWTWAMEAKWGPQDDQESMQTLHHALGLGCRFIDTAQE